MMTRSTAALLVAILGIASPAAAQDAPDADTVASWVQTFYDQTQSMTAQFTQRYRNRVYDREDISRGQVRFKKPGMMRFDYAEPNAKVIASNGSRFVVYEPPEDGQGRGQYYEQTMGQAQLPAAFSFLTGTGQLAPNYTFRLLTRLAYEGGHVLEMRPRRPTPHYTRILLYVDSGARSEALRGVVHRIVIVDEAGNTNRFDFQNQRFNANISNAVFEYSAPAGARRIQP
ncbi:MAG: outer membrane lipoprotein carrier protein LolA [Sandaracinaceae bacterium]